MIVMKPGSKITQPCQKLHSGAQVTKIGQTSFGNFLCPDLGYREKNIFADLLHSWRDHREKTNSICRRFRSTLSYKFVLEESPALGVLGPNRQLWGGFPFEFRQKPPEGYSQKDQHASCQRGWQILELGKLESIPLELMILAYKKERQING